MQHHTAVIHACANAREWHEALGMLAVMDRFEAIGFGRLANLDNQTFGKLKA